MGVVLIEDTVAIAWGLILLVDVEVFFNASFISWHEIDSWLLIFRVSRIIVLIESSSIWQLLSELTASPGLSQLIKFLDQLWRHLKLFSLDYHFSIAGLHSIVKVTHDEGIVRV